MGDGAFAGGWAPVLAVAGLAGLAAALRLYGLAHQGFWYDEANTAQLVHFSPGRMLGLIPQSESTPPLYYCVAWVWVRLFGDHEAGLRSLSAVAGVLVVPVAYTAGARLMSPRAGLITAALTACSPLLVWYSQEARSYSLLVLLTALSLLAFVYARETPTPRVLTLWVLASALALATHYFAAVTVVPEAAWLLARYHRRPAVRVAVAIVGGCGLALIPLAISQNGTGHDSWIATAPLGLRLRQIVPQFLIGTGAPARTVLRDVAIALVAVALARLVIAGPSDERDGALVAGGLALAGFVLSLVLVAVGFDDLITRNVIALWLPAALVVAGGLAHGRAGTLGIALAAALCVIGVTAVIGVAADRSLQRPDWRDVARVLAPAHPVRTEPSVPASTASGRGRARQTVGRAILIQHYRTLLPLSLYLPHLHVLGRHGARVDELDVIAMSSPQEPLCWWGAACNLIPSRMQRRYDIPGFHPEWTRHVLQFEIKQLVARRPVTLTPADVSRALHATRLRRDVLEYQLG